MLQCAAVDSVAEAALAVKGPFLRAVLDKFERMDQPDVTDLTDVRMRAEGLAETLRQPRCRILRLFQDIFLIEDVEDGERRCAAERVARVGMAVHERLSLAPVGVERLVDLLLHNGDGHGHVAAPSRGT